jgi:hypothetical protein
MSSPETPDWTRLNPVAMWRDWIVRSEEQWSAAMAQFMKDERAGGLMSRQSDELRMMHRMFSEMAQASLAAANLPSRTDFESLDERMGRLEDALAQVSADLSRLCEALVAGGAARETRPRPRRDRKAAP